MTARQKQPFKGAERRAQGKGHSAKKVSGKALAEFQKATLF
jgi:hypothetical protein